MSEATRPTRDPWYSGECVVCNGINWWYGNGRSSISGLDASSKFRDSIDYFVKYQEKYEGVCSKHEPELAASLLRIEGAA